MVLPKEEKIIPGEINFIINIKHISVFELNQMSDIVDWIKKELIDLS